MAENNPNELAELLLEVEQALVTLKATEAAERRRLLLRKMSRLFAQIDRNHIEQKRVTAVNRRSWLKLYAKLLICPVLAPVMV